MVFTTVAAVLENHLCGMKTSKVVLKSTDCSDGERDGDGLEGMGLFIY